MCDEKQVLIITDYKNKSIDIISGDNEKKEYDLCTIPKKDTDFIIKLQEDITQGLQIKSIVSNMDNSAGLMFVAYNALGGTMLQSKVSGLQKELLVLCDDSLVAITDFKGNSKKAANYIIKAYEWLATGKETTAMKQFQKCSECASEMAEAAEKLAEGFDAIGNKAEVILESTQDEEALKYEKMQKIQEDLAAYNAKLEAQKAAQNDLNSSIEELNKEYQEAKKKEKDALDRKHGFEIAELVGDVVGGIVDMVTPSLGDLGSISSDNDKTSQMLQQQLQADQQALQKCNEELEEKNEDKAELEAKKAQLEKKISDEKAQLDKANKDKSNGQNTDSIISSLTAALNMDNADLLACTSDLGIVLEAIKACTDKMKGIQNSIDKITKQCGKISDAAAQELEKATEEKEKIFDTKLELEKQRRDALSQIAEFTSLIESSSKAQNTAETAIQTLQVAVKCIKQIVTSLSTAALFWRSMQKYCDSLADAAVIENVKDIIEACDEAERIDYYFDAKFMELMLQYLGQWTALYYVCEDYLAATREVRSKVTQNIEQAPSIEEGLKAAPLLAADMGVVIKQQIATQDAIIKDLESSVSI